MRWVRAWHSNSPPSGRSQLSIDMIRRLVPGGDQTGTIDHLRFARSRCRRIEGVHLSKGYSQARNRDQHGAQCDRAIGAIDEGELGNQKLQYAERRGGLGLRRRRWSCRESSAPRIKQDAGLLVENLGCRGPFRLAGARGRS